MAYLTTCKVCGTGLVNDDLCTKCSDLIAQKTLNGETVDKEEIIKQVRADRQEEHRQEMQKMLDSCNESQGRNNWKRYLKERDECRDVIDKAIGFIESFGGSTKMNSLKKILESVDTGRGVKVKIKKVRESLGDVFKFKVGDVFKNG